MEKSVLLKPRMSEKAYGLSETTNVYVFEVPADTNKQMVAKAVTAQFNVTVTKVNITNLKGKTKRSVRKRSRPVVGYQNDVKKAYVSLKEGDQIAIFKASDEQAEKPVSKGKK